MFDDDEKPSDSSSTSSDESSSSSSIEGSEPPPAGDESEPAPAGETSPSEDEEKDKPLEDVEGHSDSSAERDVSESSSSSESSDSSRSSSSDSGSSSSSDDSSGGKSVQPPSNDDVGSCIMHACNAHDVPMDDDTVNVTSDGGAFYRFSIRLSRNFNPLPKVHDDTQSLQTGSVQGAMYLLQGSVQIIETSVRVNARIVSVETSEILQAASADGSSSSLIEDAITGAMGDAIAKLDALGAN